MADSGTYTPETIQRRYKIAEQLLGDRKKPVTHWAEGLDELAKGYFGGKMMKDSETAEKEGGARGREFMASLLMGGNATPAAAPSPQPVSAEPRGIRNNNPLNIEAGNFTTAQPGFAGSDGRFAKFDTPENGIGAASKLLDVYQNKHGLNTVNGIIGRWAPAADGNNVNAYAQAVAQKLGLDPNAPIPPEMRPQLIAAMGQHENGKPIGNVASALNKPGAPTAGASSQASRIAEALRSSDPFVARAAQGIAGNLIQKQIEGEKPTDEMREYELYRRQGGKDSFFDYKAGLKKAGAQSINIDQKQEGEYEKVTGKQMAELNAEIPKSATSARNKLATLDRLNQLLTDPNITTGAGANALLEAKRIAKQIGFDVGDVGPGEAVRAIGNQFALELRNPSGGAGMPGALSDKDREFLQASVPGLQQNPEGNKLIVDYMKRIAQRSLDVERLRQLYVRQNKRLDEGFHVMVADFADKNPLFPEADKPAPAESNSASPASIQPPTVRRFNPATGKIE